MKSNVSDHLEMVQCIYIDACAKCIADVSDLRDLETIRSRVKHGGLSFLTITLPEFARDFEASLESGVIDSNSFGNFRKSRSIPSFLKGMISRVFNIETGRIYHDDDPSYSNEAPVIVDCVRQICLAFKKIKLACKPERIAGALENYMAIEHDFQEFSTPKEALSEFRSVASVLWDGMLGDLRLDMLIPKHGPGATAERISGNQKYRWQFWHERLEPYFPFLDFAYSISSIESKEFKLVTFLTEGEEPPVRVIHVPKTLKGPRIIAIEPVCMQYAQHAILSVLIERFESREITKGHVNITNQSVNQELAILSSSTGQFATIDLSDASDRVPRDLALDMFSSNPDFRDAIDACRSTKALLPSGQVLPDLKKFASMGSALCFPVESMYFYTICVAALLKEQNLPVTYANAFRVSRNVYVYGDDIVVPCANANVVLDYLQKYNCKVNTTKTFYRGSFRESCGVDAFKGESVTPIYIRTNCPENKRQASELISWVSTANLFYKKGYWTTATYMFARVERILGPLPYVSEESPILGRVSYLGYRSAKRWNGELHHLEIRGWMPCPVYSSDNIEGYPALQKSILSLEGKPSESWMAPLDAMSKDLLHLERSARHGAVVLKRRWVPA